MVMASSHSKTGRVPNTFMPPKAVGNFQKTFKPLKTKSRIKSLNLHHAVSSSHLYDAHSTVAVMNNEGTQSTTSTIANDL